jgi:hypothetical protein
VKDASDAFAGAWVWQHVVSQYGRTIEPSRDAKKFAYQFTWDGLAGEDGGQVQKVAELQTDADTREFFDQFKRGIERYRNLRLNGELWKWCMGKEVMERVAKSIGFDNGSVFEQTVCKTWANWPNTLPKEVAQIRQYLASL